MNQIKKIQVLIDNPNSWMWDYIDTFTNDLLKENFNVDIINSHDNISRGDVLCLFSCNRVLKKLNLNKFNLVVHESDLPHGRGWSPLTWQILEGKNRIPITLFEANTEIDSGDIYIKDYIEFSGDELINEIRKKQAIKTFELVRIFLRKYNQINPMKQQGVCTEYKRRYPSSSQLDFNKSLKDQFNLLKVVDNEKYPAFFNHMGSKYVLKIEKLQ